MMKCLHIFDQFSRKPKLNIDAKSRLTNIYVALISIFIFICYMIVTIILTSNIFKKKEFQMIENTDSKTFNNITLDTNNPFSVLVTNSIGNEFKDPHRIFDVKLRYFDFDHVDNGETKLKMTEINQTTCLYNEIEGDVNSIYKNIYKTFKSIQCWDLKPYNVPIFGSESPGYGQGTLVFYINQCVNTTASSNCLPQNQLNQILREVKITFIYPNRDIDNNSHNPIVKYTDGKVLRFTNSMKTRYIFEIDTLEYLSLEGLFFESIVTYNSYKIRAEINSFQNLELGTVYDKGTIGTLNFYGSGKKKIFQRRYEKLYSVFPYLVSLYHIIIIAFKIFTPFFGGEIFDEFFFSKIVGKENYENFKQNNNNLLYEDLFKKQTQNENIIFEENIINYNQEYCQNNNNQIEEKKEDGSYLEQDKSSENSNPSSVKMIEENVMKNNFFQKEERKKLSSREICSNQNQIQTKNNNLNKIDENGERSNFRLKKNLERRKNSINHEE